MHDAIAGERGAGRLDQRRTVAAGHRRMAQDGADAGRFHVRRRQHRQHAISVAGSRDIDVADFAMSVGRPHEATAYLARQRRIVDKSTLAPQERFVFDPPWWPAAVCARHAATSIAIAFSLRQVTA
jgi:hypothetical protein